MSDKKEVLETRQVKSFAKNNQKKIAHMSDAVLNGMFVDQSRKLQVFENMKHQSAQDRQDHLKCAACLEAVKQELQLRSEEK